MKHRPSPRLLAALPLLLGIGAGCQGSSTPGASEATSSAAPAPAAPGAPAPASGAPSPSATKGVPAGTGVAKADDGAKEEEGSKEDVALERIRAEGQLGPGKNTLFIDIAAPEGAKLTLESPLNVRGSGGIGLEFPRRLSGPLSTHSMPLRLPIDVADGATGPARLELTYYWCTEGNEAACRRERARIDVELDLTGSSAGGEAHLSYRARGNS